MGLRLFVLAAHGTCLGGGCIVGTFGADRMILLQEDSNVCAAAVSSRAVSRATLEKQPLQTVIPAEGLPAAV